MKLLLASTLVAASILVGGATEVEVNDGELARHLQEELCVPDVCVSADGASLMDESCYEAYCAAKAECAGIEESARRRAQFTGLPPPLSIFPENHIGTAQGFVEPCSSLPDDRNEALLQGWYKIPPNDDLSHAIQIDFNFNFYGVDYPPGTTLFINNNGNLSFGRAIGVKYSPPESWPFLDPVIAPFWADVDTTHETTGMSNGEVWYKKTPNAVFVVWDRVGYYSKKRDKANTFQVVITDGSVASLGTGAAAPVGTIAYRNICFCYGDMDWTTGAGSGGANGFPLFPVAGFPGAAIVGINPGTPSNFANASIYGNFGSDGIVFDGPGPAFDGLEWLEYRGFSVLNQPSKPPHYDDLYEPICFDSHRANLPPTCTGFPSGNFKVVFCDRPEVLNVAFATPEAWQTIDATYTGAFPPGTTVTKTNLGTSVNFQITIPAARFTDAGLYNVTFVATDSYVIPSSVTKVLSIKVFDCGDDDKCTPIDPIDQCDSVDPYPFCTPWRSEEFCPADKSFPTLVKARTEIADNDAPLIRSNGFWFDILDDRAAQYAFTTSHGFNAPQVYCCVSTAADLASCFPLATTSFVIKASGHHSGSGVFAFPSGFGGVELLSGVTMTLTDVLAALVMLSPDPNKIIVEELIPGPGGALPVEYKFHMFNGEIGAITAIYNRGTDCACYSEFDANMERLDYLGCYEPSFPAATDGACYKVDCTWGKEKAMQIKGMDICSDPLPPIPSCIWNDLVDIATELSQLIGVYMRIDMFVSGGLVYVQEYTLSHLGGFRHCFARLKATGCIDSCFMGELWYDSGTSSPTASLEYGGPMTPTPPIFTSWDAMTGAAQCGLTTTPPSPPYGSCFFLPP